MNIIGISGLHNSVAFKKRSFPGLAPSAYRIAQGFDSAAAIVTDEGILAAAAEERFVREKSTGAFPINAINYCLKASNVKLSEIDYLAHGFNYERYKSNYDQAGLSRQQFEEVYSRKAQLDILEEHFDIPNWSEKFIQVPHHIAHAASTFYVSGMDEALIVVVDGMGEQESLTVAVGKGNDIEIINQIPSIHSLGILYSVFTLYLGFDFNMDEYKIMGLAPYGNPRRYFDKIMGLVTLHKDGTHTIPVLFQNETEEEKETYQGTLNVLTEMFGTARNKDEKITQHHQDIAAALQSVLQTCLLHVLTVFKKETDQKDLCMAGGVALNCTCNGVIKRSRLFRSFFVQPAAGDDGSALGAALYVQRLRKPEQRYQKMSLPFWGPQYSDKEVCDAIESRKECRDIQFETFEKLTEEIVRRIANGEIIGWFQGRMEFGPRALGSRSIIADPREVDMRDRINALVKKREEFRPFAPVVTAERAAKFFEMDKGDEELFSYMLCVTQVRSEYRDQLPAITHVDGSARVQTVSKNENSRFWHLLTAFEKVSNSMPILLNTSFNVRGQPIVCTPKEAVDTFLMAGLDALVIEDHLVVAKS